MVRFSSMLLSFAALLLAISSASAGADFETIAHFPGGAAGLQPEAGVIVDPADGRTLYGTTDEGGSAGSGVLFRLAPPTASGVPWARRALYDFPGTEGGSIPEQVLSDGSGGLFGYTLGGGSHLYGTVFHATPKKGSAAWQAVQLHSFAAGADGAYPSGLVGYGATLIGVTDQGGIGPCTSPFGELTHCGTVYQLTPPSNSGGTWSEKVIYAFTGGSDGATPNGHLLVRGNSIIGTTTRGGDGPCTYNDARVGCGVIYELTAPAAPGGAWTQTVLYSFPGGPDGAVPIDGVIPGDGNGLFGVTASGGNTDSSGFQLGTVYRLAYASDGWRHIMVYRFAGSRDDYSPNGGLYYDPAKKTLYGTTYLGGASRSGTVFSLEKLQAGPWSKVTIHNFTDQGDGRNPSSEIVADSTGALYGTTLAGSHGGTVYRISFSP